MAEELKYVGKSVPLRKAEDLATGKAEFTDDMPADLHVKILRSPHAHAMIKSIDTNEAEKLDGVEAVITHKDVPEVPIPRQCQRAAYILDPHLRHVGDNVAAVAATSKAVAEKAIQLIKVEYEILPAVFDPEEAIKPDAPKLYPEGNVFGRLEMLKLVGTHEPTLLSYGNVEKGFAQADVIVEKKFEITPQVHSQLEPYICIAEWRSGELTLWTPTQTPYEVRDGMAFVFGLPEGKVRILSEFVGGGFGGRYLGRYQGITALLSKKAGGKRTKCVFTREEALAHTRRCHDKYTVKIGARKDGTFTAIKLLSYADIGGYGNTFGNSNFWGAMPICQYNAENQWHEGWDVHVNHFSPQPYRSTSIAVLALGVEQVVDMVAEKLGMDPVEIRLINAANNGDLSPIKPWVDNTPNYERGRLVQYPANKIIQEVADEIGWERQRKVGQGKPIFQEGSKVRALGLAYGGYCSGLLCDGLHSMALAMNKDGSFNIMSGCQDIGQGCDTTLCQLVAEFFDVPIEYVSILTGDTHIGQYDSSGARGSSELTTGGRLLLQAAEKIKEELRQMASNVLEVLPEEIEIGNKTAYIKEDPESSIPFIAFLTNSITKSAQGPWGSLFPLVDEEKGYKAANAMAQGVEVEVDLETGELKLLKIVTGNCPGRMINPTIVKGQYTGGAVQSLGMALQEEWNFDEERSEYLHTSFVDYRVPRAKDYPSPVNIVIEEEIDLPPHKGLPYGAIGVGEIGHWGGPATMASAIYNAIGVRMAKTPMTAERILKVIKEKEGR